MHFVVCPQEDGSFDVWGAQVDWTGGGVSYDHVQYFTFEQLKAFVAAQEQNRPRWVWPDSNVLYAQLHAAGIRVERCHDLRLARSILRNSNWLVKAFEPARTQDRAEIDSWEHPPVPPSTALFTVNPSTAGDPRAELERQVVALASATPAHSGRLRMLLAAESAGALIAVEMTRAGVPWNVSIHDQILTEQLGPRVPYGTRPAKLEALAGQLRVLLDAPHLNPDSHKDLLGALNNAGFGVTSTSKWQIQGVKHPATPVLLDYKRRSRMLTANGWAWQDEWVADGRFRPVYVPGGVVTGRWGADGGGALQLPHYVRPAVIADDGWTFVLSDAAQLEPRILAAMSGDQAMAVAGRGHDLYEGIKEVAQLESRNHAKMGMLGAMYGGTTGISAQVLPRFKVAFVQAMAMLEGAARAGEQGKTVHTWLGRTSSPGNFGSGSEGEDSQSAQARRQATRAYGRFTRNFIVQGSAAEWALAWMSMVRQELFTLTLKLGGTQVTDGPHLVFFLHDEILIHTPQHLATEVVELVRSCAARAAELYFAGSGVEFPVSAHINTTYTEPEES